MFTNAKIIVILINFFVVQFYRRFFMWTDVLRLACLLSFCLLWLVFLKIKSHKITMAQYFEILFNKKMNFDQAIKTNRTQQPKMKLDQTGLSGFNHFDPFGSNIIESVSTGVTFKVGLFCFSFL